MTDKLYKIAAIRSSYIKKHHRYRMMIWDKFDYSILTRNIMYKKKKGKGTVKGAGSYVPGSNVKITVKAAKGHKIKTIKVGSSTMKVIVKGSKYSFTLKNVVKNQKVTVVFK